MAACPAGSWIYQHWSPEALWWLILALAIAVAFGFELLRRQQRPAPRALSDATM